MNFGVDVGNGYTKYGRNMKFASLVRQGELNKVKRGKANVHAVEYKGLNYVVGEGNSFTGRDRYFGQNYKIALLTALALSSNRTTIEANVVTGTPVDHYNSIAEKVVEHFNSLDVEEIVVDGIKHRIELKSINVFTEGALPVKDNDDSHIITIDVGASTVNILEWKDQEIINQYTHDGSINEISQEVSRYINMENNINTKPEFIRTILGEKEMYTRDGIIDISATLDIIRGYIDNILAYTTGFNFDGCKHIKVFGGGALATFDFWKERLPKAQLEKNSQFINLQVYQAVAEAINEA